VSEQIIHVVLEAASVLFQRGDVIEVRVPRARGQKTISGYFSNFEKLAVAVNQLEIARYPGIYWTLNPVNRELLARADHHVKPFAANTTKDVEVLRNDLQNSPERALTYERVSWNAPFWRAI
jgi:hypothetical protein